MIEKQTCGTSIEKISAPCHFLHGFTNRKVYDSSVIIVGFDWQGFSCIKRCSVGMSNAAPSQLQTICFRYLTVHNFHILIRLLALPPLSFLFGTVNRRMSIVELCWLLYRRHDSLTLYKRSHKTDCSWQVRCENALTEQKSVACGTRKIIYLANRW